VLFSCIVAAREKNTRQQIRIVNESLLESVGNSCDVFVFHESFLITRRIDKENRKKDRNVEQTTIPAIIPGPFSAEISWRSRGIVEFCTKLLTSRRVR